MHSWPGHFCSMRCPIFLKTTRMMEGMRLAEPRRRFFITVRYFSSESRLPCSTSSSRYGIRLRLLHPTLTALTLSLTLACLSPHSSSYTDYNITSLSCRVPFKRCSLHRIQLNQLMFNINSFYYWSQCFVHIRHSCYLKHGVSNLS